MQLSEEQKQFSDLFFAVLKFTWSFEPFQKRDDIQS